MLKTRKMAPHGQMQAGQTWPVQATRDRRIDVLRGVAVLGIALNHVSAESPHIANFGLYKFGHLFAFDFADVFLLISGIVAGIVFFPLYARAGAGACFEKAVRRSGQIWGVQIACVLAILPAIWIAARVFGVEIAWLAPFERSLLDGILRNALLYDPTPLLNVLPVYVMMLPAVPLALMLLNRSPVLYFLAIGLLWAAFWGPAFLSSVGAAPVRGPFETAFFIYPLSAQLLFFTGVAIGAFKPACEVAVAQRSGVLFWSAVSFLIITNYLHQVHLGTHHFSQKALVGPLRILELLAVLVVIARLVGPGAFASHRVGPIEVCGRHVLPVFAVSTGGAFLLTYLCAWGAPGRLGFGVCLGANVALAVATGFLFERFKTASARGRRPLLWRHDIRKPTEA